MPSRYIEDPEIRSMRIRAWYRAVVAASQLTPSELEQAFSLGTGDRPRSCIWDKYRRGEVEPRRGTGRQPGLIERVETSYPGTAVWLSSPLWRLADRAPMEMSEIRRIYEAMPKLIRSIFVATKEEATGLFWRRPVEVDHACEILRRFRDVDAFITLLTIMREAETIQDQDQYFVVSHAVKEHLTELCETHDIIASTLGADLLRYLGNTWARPGWIDVQSS